MNPQREPCSFCAAPTKASNFLPHPTFGLLLVCGKCWKLVKTNDRQALQDRAVSVFLYRDRFGRTLVDRMPSADYHALVADLNVAVAELHDAYLERNGPCA